MYYSGKGHGKGISTGYLLGGNLCDHGAWRIVAFLMRRTIMVRAGRGLYSVSGLLFLFLFLLFSFLSSFSYIDYGGSIVGLP